MWLAYLSILLDTSTGLPLRWRLCVLRYKQHEQLHHKILRHRSFSFQEFSQRYAIAMDLELPRLRRQDVKNRQNSIDDLDTETTEFIDDRISKHFREAEDLYGYMIDKGVAKECARAVLPLNTTTRLYMSGTIRSWLTLYRPT